MARFIDSAIIIMLVAVVLFCSDAAYTHAIYRELLLDGDILERSIYSAMYNGFVLNFTFFVSLSFYGVFIPVMLVLFRGFLLIIFRTLFMKIEERMSKVTCRVDGVGFFKVKAIVYYVLVILCSFLFIRLLIHHEAAGIKEALTIRNNVINRTAPEVKLRDFDGVFYFLYCGESKCAAFDAQDKIIRYYLAEEQNITSEKIKTTYKSQDLF